MPDWSTYIAALGRGSKFSQLAAFGNMTFYKDYSITNSNADFSSGSPTATSTANRSASNPATYTDESGIILTLTSSNISRFTNGYYNSNGYISKPGIFIEGASTNLVPDSSNFSAATWATSNLTVTTNSLVSPDGSSNANTLTSNAGTGTFLLASATTGQTFSVFLRRKTGTGPIQITANGSTYSTVTLVSNQWARFQITTAVSSQLAGIRILIPSDEIYAWGAQYENLAFASSYIPSSGGAVTRNLEVLSYIISSNRTAATESIFVNHTLELPLSSATAQFVMSNDTKVRQLSYRSTGPDFVFRPNATDNIGVTLNDTGAQPAYTSVIRAATCSFNSNPSVTGQHYKDSVSKGTTTTNFTAPAWGTNFYIGSDSAGQNQLFGLVHSVLIYSDQKSPTDVTNITNILDS